MADRHLIRRLTTLLLVVPFFGLGTAHGQQTTEQYVPIGESPGVSDKYSYIGEITKVDQDEHTITVDSNRGEHVIKVTDATRIWLDRSKRKKTNTPGSYSDCQVGRRVEIMHEPDDEALADWIKIESR